MNKMRLLEKRHELLKEIRNYRGKNAITELKNSLEKFNMGLKQVEKASLNFDRSFKWLNLRSKK